MDRLKLINLDKTTLFSQAKALKDTHPELVPWDIENPNDIMNFVLNFYLESLERMGAWGNALAQEFTIGTAQTRENVLNHALQLGYVPTNRVASSVDVDITYQTPGSNVTMSPGDLVISARGNNGEKVFFENSENVTFLSTAAVLTGVPFVEGRTKSQVETSQGRAFQIFTINDKVVQDSVVVSVDGTEWTEAATFTGLGSTAQRYRLRILNEQTYQIIFGDGTNGEIPTEDVQITIEYRRGGGTRGNVKAETISTIEADSLGIMEEVTNPAAAVGGTDPESTEQIRYNAVRLPRLNNRIVTLRDIESFGDAYDGVSRTRAISNFNSPIVYIIPDGGGSPTTTLLEDVQADINEIVVLGHFVSVLAPNFKTVNLELNLVLNPAYKQSVVEGNVQTALQNLLDPLFRYEDGVWAREFGDPLKVSEVLATTRNVTGVMAVEILNPTPTAGSDVLVSVQDDEIITTTGSTITLNSVLSRNYEGTRNKSIKALFANPKYNSE